MSMHGMFLDNSPTALVVVAGSNHLFESDTALVAMRVNALHGGKKSIKILLWVAWILYAIPTVSLLAVGLAQSQGGRSSPSALWEYQLTSGADNFLNFLIRHVGSCAFLQHMLRAGS